MSLISLFEYVAKSVGLRLLLSEGFCILADRFKLIQNYDFWEAVFGLILLVVEVVVGGDSFPQLVALHVLFGSFVYQLRVGEETLFDDRFDTLVSQTQAS